MLKRTAFFLSLLILTINYIIASPVSINGQLSVSGLQLVNSCGNPVQLRGVSTHGLQWFYDCLPDAAIDFAASSTGMGCDVFRIAMYVGENGYLTNPTEFTNRVNSLVEKATARGMYVIIDWHVLTPGDPNVNIADARTFWTNMANTHKDKVNVIYEICNEPNGGGVTWATVRTYANDIIPRIRAIDPDAIIIVGTPNWSQLGADVVNNQLSYSNIMYAFHFYAASHATTMLSNYASSLPIFCTEWAASEASGTGTLNTARASEFISIMGGNNPAGVKISWASWSYSDNSETSAMFNANTCPNGPYDTGHLSAEGNYIRNNILTPGKTFIACNTTQTFTPTRTRTPQPTNTNTPAQTKTFTATYSKTATVTYTKTTGPSPTITMTHTASGTATATPAPSSVAIPCAAGIKVDGDLTDAGWLDGAWTANNRLVTGTNPQGASAQFKVRWDNTALYVAVDVSDTSPFNDSGANWYDDSSVEVYLDMNHNASTNYQADDFQFSMRYNDQTLREQGNKQGTATGAVAARAGGYIVEMKLPWSVLGATPAAASVYGFDVGVNIDSAGGAREGVLMWAGTGNNYADTSAFGNAVVQACAITPTFTASKTMTATVSKTVTNTPASTASFTPSFTKTFTAASTNTATPISTATFTKTVTQSYTPTLSSTASRSATPTATNTPYYSPSMTQTVTQTVTGTPPTATQTYSCTIIIPATFTFTYTPVNTATRTFTPRDTETATPVNTLANTPENTVTNTHTPVNTQVNTSLPTPTYTNTQAASSTNTPVVPTATVTPFVNRGDEKTYPNPYDPEHGDLNVEFNLESEATEVELAVYTKGLRLVSRTRLGAFAAGHNRATVDRSRFKRFSAGTYFYMIISKNNGVENKGHIRNLNISR